jgi:hypothetical protein
LIASANINDQRPGNRPAVLLFAGSRCVTRHARYGVFFGAHQIATIDLTNPKRVGHVPEQGSAMSSD